MRGIIEAVAEMGNGQYYVAGVLGSNDDYAILGGLALCQSGIGCSPVMVDQQPLAPMPWIQMQECGGSVLLYQETVGLYSFVPWMGKSSS